MDVKARLIKLRPSSDGDVYAWKSEIERLREEALLSIKNEGVMIESWFQGEISGEPYLLAYIRAADIAAAQKVAEKSSLEVDRIHGKFKLEAWDQSEVIDFELLVDLENS